MRIFTPFKRRALAIALLGLSACGKDSSTTTTYIYGNDKGDDKGDEQTQPSQKQLVYTGTPYQGETYSKKVFESNGVLRTTTKDEFLDAAQATVRNTFSPASEVYYNDTDASTGGAAADVETDEVLASPASPSGTNSSARVDDVASDNSSQAGVSEEAAAGSNDADSDVISGTNIQVDGVDEADRVKYDGSHLFISGQSHMFADEQADQGHHLRIVATNPDNQSASQQSTLFYADDHYEAHNIYLTKDTQNNTDGVVTLASSFEPFIGCGVGLADFEGGQIEIDRAMYPGSSEQDYKREVVINTVSVSDPTSPSIDWTVTIEGDYKDSRKIGDTLYIVTENQPEYEYVNFEDQQTLDQYIDQLTLEDYLPNYTINGDDKGLLVAAEDCLVPDISNDNLLIQSTTIVTAINLKDKTIDNNLCIADRIQTMYMSPSSIYLSRSIHSQDSSSTLLHKITLSESSMAYAASGTVEGRIGWSTPSYFMSENDDYLRILTTLWDSNTNQDVHKLSVLKANDDNLLEQVAQIPNANQPAAIGKPNESIFAVRFWGDRAYVVTFEQTDPLYVIDVSNPLNPNILGELEMPGFSTYLRPLNDNYLFGLGRNDGNDLDGNRLNGGVKVSLYDISDTANPSIAKEFIFGGWGSQTVAGNNPHALNFQFLSDDQVRVSFPLSVYPEGAISEDDGDESTTVSISISNQEQVHGLALFDINDLTSDAIFTENGMIDTSDTANNSYSGRARIHNDTVFYINGFDVWSADWSTPENATGPQ